MSTPLIPNPFDAMRLPDESVELLLFIVYHETSNTRIDMTYDKLLIVKRFNLRKHKFLHLF